MTWLFFAVLSGLGAAVLAIIIKLGLQSIPTFTLIFYFALMLIAMFILIIFLFQKKELLFLHAFSRRECSYLFIASLINALAFMFYFAALKYGKACNVLAVDRLSIVYIVFLSFLFFQEPVSVKSIVGAVCMFFGVYLIVF